MAEINEINPEFVVIPGDFTEDGEPEQFRLAREIFEGLLGGDTSTSDITFGEDSSG